MNEKPDGGLLRRLWRFIGERSFYFILLLSTAVIAVTAWLFTAAMDSTKPRPTPDLQKSVTAAAPEPSDKAVTYTWMPEVQPPKQILPEPTSAPVLEPETAAPVEAAGEEPAAEVLATAFGWPVKGDISMTYSVDALLYDRTMEDWRTHGAIDIEADLGEKVLAAGDGTVERIFTDPMYGVTMIIYHGAGLRSVYCNLAGLPAVQTGDVVRLGQVIGAVGSTADAENGDVNHLHFAMTLDETRVNPLEFLPER